MPNRTNLGPVTAYAIAVKNGFEGTEAQWLESLTGPRGDTGLGVPEVTTADNGKFARVVDGVWTAVALANAEEVSF